MTDFACLVSGNETLFRPWDRDTTLFDAARWALRRTRNGSGVGPPRQMTQEAAIPKVRMVASHTKESAYDRVQS